MISSAQDAPSMPASAESHVDLGQPSLHADWLSFMRLRSGGG
jgi:hypothetical protein